MDVEFSLQWSGFTISTWQIVLVLSRQVLLFQQIDGCNYVLNNDTDFVLYRATHIGNKTELCGTFLDYV